MQNLLDIVDIYRVPVPFSDNMIIVYGDPSMLSYEWRLENPNGKVFHDTFKNHYGCAEIALRDALIETTKS